MKTEMLAASVVIMVTVVINGAILWDFQNSQNPVRLIGIALVMEAVFGVQAIWPLYLRRECLLARQVTIC